MPEPCTYQHQRAVAVREPVGRMVASSGFSVDPLNAFVGADAQPMLRRVICICKRLDDTLLQRFAALLILVFHR